MGEIWHPVSLSKYFSESNQKSDQVMYWSLEKNSTFTGWFRNLLSFSRLKQMKALDSSSNSTKALPSADCLIVDVFFRSLRVGKMNEIIFPNFFNSPNTSCQIDSNSFSLFKSCRLKSCIVTRTTQLDIVQSKSFFSLCSVSWFRFFTSSCSLLIFSWATGLPIIQEQKVRNSGSPSKNLVCSSVERVYWFLRVNGWWS